MGEKNIRQTLHKVCYSKQFFRHMKIMKHCHEEYLGLVVLIFKLEEIFNEKINFETILKYY